MRSILWTPILILFASVFCSAQNTLYIPQVANGFDPGSVAWITAVVVTNTAAAGTALASGTITFTKDNGTAWSLLINDDQGNLIGNASSFPFQIAGGQTRAFVTTATDSVVLTGFATVTSNLPVTAGAIFIQFSGSNFARLAQGGVPGSAALTRQAIVATRISNQSEDTGVAVANPNNSTATITFTLLDRNGVAAFPPVARNLGAQGHTAFFISQLFPAIPSRFFGTLQVTSSTPLAAVSLVFDGNVFGTTPVFPLQ